MIRPELEHLAVPADTLRPHEHNPRLGDVDTIADSIRANGQYRPVIARKATGEVLVGSHTLQAMRSLDAPRIAAVLLDVTEQQAAQIVAVDNRTSDVAGNDEGLLAALLEQLEGDYTGTGWDEHSHTRLLRQIEDAKDWTGSRGDVPFTLGRVFFNVDSDRYREWADGVRAACGDDKHDVIRELADRLGVEVAT